MDILPEKGRHNKPHNLLEGIRNKDLGTVVTDEGLGHAEAPTTGVDHLPSMAGADDRSD